MEESHCGALTHDASGAAEWLWEKAMINSLNIYQYSQSLGSAVHTQEGVGWGQQPLKEPHVWPAVLVLSA